MAIMWTNLLLTSQSVKEVLVTIFSWLYTEEVFFRFILEKWKQELAKQSRNLSKIQIELGNLLKQNLNWKCKLLDEQTGNHFWNIVLQYYKTAWRRTSGEMTNSRLVPPLKYLIVLIKLTPKKITWLSTMEVRTESLGGGMRQDSL